MMFMYACVYECIHNLGTSTEKDPCQQSPATEKGCVSSVGTVSQLLGA